MATRTLALTPSEDELLDGLVASGRYADAAEAARAAFRLLEKEEAEWAAFLARINGAYDEGERGELADGTLDEVMERVLRTARGG